MKITTVALLAILAFLQYKLWLDPHGLFNTWRLQQHVQQQEVENIQSKQRNENLKADIHNLKTDLDTLEAHARNDLGMIKKGETYYQMSEKN